VTTTVTDTGERKVMYGYQARHLKAKVVQEPSAEACTQVRQSFDIDGWFADICKVQAVCSVIAPPVQMGAGCQDMVISRRLGTGKPGYPLQENITMPNSDGSTTTVTVQVSELTKQEISAELFDVPSGYRQVSSLAELNAVSPAPQQAAAVPMPTPQGTQGAGGTVSGQQSAAQQAMNAPNPGARSAAGQQGVWQQMNQFGIPHGNTPMNAGMGGMPPMTGMPGTGGPQGSSTAVAAPQALGPKAPGKIRIGVASPEAQVGQGNNAGADYSTPIRNAVVALMSGPAVEIAALDSRAPVQLQAEGQQKQCDYILYSSVVVKHNSGGGLGGFMKKAAPLTSMVPMVGMAGGMGGAVAAQAAGAAASAAAMSAQQQAMSQLSGFNGQIKSKDDVTVQYQLASTGQTSPRLQNTLNGKAKSDGEDVLTPLLQQAANTVLTEVTKK
jgi:hypothetical protein